MGCGDAAASRSRLTNATAFSSVPWAPSEDRLQVAIAEEFLELVHDHQQVGRVIGNGLFVGVHQAELAHAQGGFDDLLDRHSFDFRGAEEAVGLHQGLRHRLDGIAARTEVRHAPRRSGGGHQAATQRGLESAIHQRRLAAARGADDRQEAVGRELVDHGVDLALATEEEVLLALVERTQAGKWIGQPCASDQQRRSRLRLSGDGRRRTQPWRRR